MKPIEFFLALRFLKEGHSQTVLIFAGATAGVGVVVFLISLIVGLQQTLIEQTMGLHPHVIVEPRENLGPDSVYEAADTELVFSRVEPRPGRFEDIEEWRDLSLQVGADPDAVGVTAVAFGPGTAVRGQALQPIEIRGIDPGTYREVINLEERLVDGQYRFDDQGAVIGYELAEELGVEVGDRIRFVIAEGEGRTFVVRGLLDLGARTPNRSWAYVSIREGQSLLDLGDSVTAIQIVLEDLFDAVEVADRLQNQVEHEVVSWTETNRDLLRALRTQTASTLLIAVFVAISVALGIASVLVVTVVQKRGQIGVLRAMGAPMGTVLRVFLIQGATVGLVGSIFGSLLGTGLAIGFSDFIRDDRGATLFPVQPSPTIFAIACVLATLAGLLAAVVPARRAARLDPADAITHG